MKTAIFVSAAIGVITIAATLAIGHARSERATEEYGKRLMNGCSSCHPDAGAEPGEFTLFNAIANYPGDKIVQRINACLTLNMNRRPLPEHSDEMSAMISWLRFLASKSAATGAAPPIEGPRASSHHVDGAQSIFEKRCADCHGKNGAGLPASRDPARGYLFPPLWGTESFPDASEMTNPTTLARFIKAKMPLGRADLDQTDASDLAAFILSKSRPHMAK